MAAHQLDPALCQHVSVAYQSQCQYASLPGTAYCTDHTCPNCRQKKFAFQSKCAGCGGVAPANPTSVQKLCPHFSVSAGKVCGKAAGLYYYIFFFNPLLPRRQLHRAIAPDTPVQTATTTSSVFRGGVRDVEEMLQIQMLSVVPLVWWM